MEQSSFNWYVQCFTNTFQPYEVLMNGETGDKTIVIRNNAGQKVMFLFNNNGGYLTFRIGG